MGKTTLSTPIPRSKGIQHKAVRKPDRHRCTKCNKSYTNIHVLKWHFDSIHLNKTYACDICEKFYTRHDSLLKHKRKTHQNFIEKIKKTKKAVGVSEKKKMAIKRTRKIMEKNRIIIAGKTSKKLNFTTSNKGSRSPPILEPQNEPIVNPSISKRIRFPSSPPILHVESPVLAVPPQQKSPIQTIKVKVGKANAKPFKCPVCHGGFSRGGNLNRHRRLNRCRGRGPGSCRVEKREGVIAGATHPVIPNSPQEMEVEVEPTHNEIEEVPCTTASLMSIGAINENLEEGGEEDKPYKCKVCSSGYRSERGLKSHIKQKKCNAPPKLGLTPSKEQPNTDSNKEVGHHSQGQSQSQRSSPRNIGAPGAGDNQPRQRTPFLCDICGSPFSSALMLSLHKDTTKCRWGRQGQFMKKPEAAVKVPQTPTGDQEISSSPFSKESPIKNLSASEIRRRQCLECTTIFGSRELLKHHIITDHGDKTLFQCQECPAWYLASSKLNLHISSLHPDPVPKSKKMVPSSLKSENSTNSKSNARQCPHPPTQNAQKDDSSTKQSHKIQPPFCVTCSKSFGNRDALKDHQVTEHGRTIRQCPHCPRWYLMRSNLRKHLVEEHKEQIVYKCPVCPAKFSNFQSMRNHRNEVHLKSHFRCNHCNVLFSSGGCLRKHQHRTGHRQSIAERGRGDWMNMKKAVPVSSSKKSGASNAPQKLKQRRDCVPCRKTFATRDLLKTHVIKRHKRTVFECQQCPEWYASPQKLRLHVARCHNENQRKIIDSKSRFKCTRCQGTYSSVANLRKHQRRKGHPQLLGERHALKDGNDGGGGVAKVHRGQGQGQARPKGQVQDDNRRRSTRTRKPKKVFSYSLSTSGKENSEPYHSSSSESEDTVEPIVNGRGRNIAVVRPRRVPTPTPSSSSSASSFGQDDEDDSEPKSKNDVKKENGGTSDSEDEYEEASGPPMPVPPLIYPIFVNGAPTQEQLQEMEEMDRRAREYNRQMEEFRQWPGRDPFYFLHMGRYKPDP